MWASWVCNWGEISNTPPISLCSSTQPAQSARLFKYRQEDPFLVGTKGTTTCFQISTFPVLVLQKRSTHYLDFWFSFLHSPPLLSTSKQSFPKTLLSSLFLLFQHLSSSVLLLRKWYNRVRRLHQRSGGTVMETIHLQCCYKDILSS